MITTAIYHNRQADKSSVEALFHLPEFGDTVTEFYLQRDLFAIGYVRVVYGDHGPYVEFLKDQIKLALASRFGNSLDILPTEEDSPYYYYWLYPVGHAAIKVYWQIKPVTDMPNAPRREDGKESAFNRKEGYADYKRGMYYVDPYFFMPPNRILRIRNV